jgi:diguanylate cyclase (GGDEF)-like protein
VITEICPGRSLFDAPRLHETGSLVPPAPHEQQLAAAQRQIDALLLETTALKHKLSQHAESLAKANRFAFHDELTGLPNRRLLKDHFDQAVAHAIRQHDQVLLLFLDLDKFKSINDRFGHLTADRVLKQVALRLTSCIRSSDTACRYGGDEFVLLLPDIAGRQQAIAATDKIAAQLAVPYVIDHVPIYLTASIGTSVYPVDGQEHDELLRVADSNMYRQKAGGDIADAQNVVMETAAA